MTKPKAPVKDYFVGKSQGKTTTRTCLFRCVAVRKLMRTVETNVERLETTGKFAKAPRTFVRLTRLVKGREEGRKLMREYRARKSCK